MQELRARKRDRDQPERAFGPDGHGLPVAVRGQGNVRGKSWPAGDDLKITVAAASLDVAIDVADALAPGSGQRSALGHDIAGKVEFVAVAGAGEGLIKSVATSADGISGATSDALGRAIVEGNGAGAGPDAGQTGERSRLRVTYRTGHGRHEQGGSRQYHPSDQREGVDLAVCFIVATLPNDRCMVRLQMPHSTFPIRSCR